MLPSLAVVDVDRQLELLTAGAVDVISEAELRTKLERGAPLRVKLGIDPTASDIHLGFAVVLRRLRLFQDLGHVAVLILGDFTAMVGDPSGKSATRPRLSQGRGRRARRRPTSSRSARILDTAPETARDRAATPSGSAPLDMEDVLAPDLAGDGRPHARARRLRQALRRAASPISLMEFLYPLLQATDSVEIRADVELGGTDQLFNLLMGRHLQTAGRPGAAGRAHDAAARRPRRRAEDVEVARQLRRDRRAAGRAVRQAHVDPRRR